MRGQVLGVDKRSGDGLVAGDDGQRYRFAPADWADRGGPAVGAQVDFDAADGRALSIFRVPGTMPAVTATPIDNDRNKIVAALLAFFLGVLGIDRFYLGRTGSGIAILILSCTVIGMAITAPLSLIDMVRYLVMSDAEFAQRYARRR